LSYLTFLEQIFEGKVRITTAEVATKSEIQSGVEVLRSFESQWRLALAGTAPDFCPEAASWAGANLHRACQLLMFRDLPAEEVSATLENNYPHASATSATATPTNRAQVHYNVDLLFRFLPDLWKFTHAVAQDDPLSKVIGQWCRAWPLSSVGATNLQDQRIVTDPPDLPHPTPTPSPPLTFDISGFVNHPCLMQLYADRILQHQDLTRINDPNVASQLRYSTGIHEKLNEKIGRTS